MNDATDNEIDTEIEETEINACAEPELRQAVDGRPVVIGIGASRRTANNP